MTPCWCCKLLYGKVFINQKKCFEFSGEIFIVYYCLLFYLLKNLVGYMLYCPLPFFSVATALSMLDERNWFSYRLISGLICPLTKTLKEGRTDLYHRSAQRWKKANSCPVASDSWNWMLFCDWRLLILL